MNWLVGAAFSSLRSAVAIDTDAGEVHWTYCFAADLILKSRCWTIDALLLELLNGPFHEEAPPT